MVKWHPVCSIEALQSDGYAVLELATTAIAVFDIQGDLYAVEDVCTHDGGELAGGPIEGHTITCPRHGARFDLQTGQVLAPPACIPLRTFPVRIQGGYVEVEIG
ncbi:MAG: Rieske (2Fe-2S) protein [Gammaproteobacteria bacterium]